MHVGLGRYGDLELVALRKHRTRNPHFELEDSCRAVSFKRPPARMWCWFVTKIVSNMPTPIDSDVSIEQPISNTTRSKAVTG